MGALSACERGARWERALCVLGEMNGKGMQPNAVCYGAAVSACEKSSQWQTALLLFGGVTFGPAVLGSALAACEAAAQWEQALHLLSCVLWLAGDANEAAF